MSLARLRLPGFRPRLTFYLYYASLYAPIAVAISFLPLWMRARGLTEADVGLCLSLGPILAVFANPLVGALADSSGQRVRLLIVLVVAAALSSLLYFAAEGFAAVLTVYLLIRLFSSGHIPLSESIVLANMERLRLDFGRVRSWGSAAVVVVSIALGMLVDRFGTTAIIAVMSAGFMAQIPLACALPNQAVPRPAGYAATRAPVSEVLRLPGFLMLLCSAAISQACHGVFYAYNAFYWQASGQSSTIIGALWGLGVTAEIIVFVFGGRITARLSPVRILAVACLFGAIRWGLLGLSGSLAVALVVQLIQGMTLGMTQVGVALYIKSAAPAHVLSSGTGVYAALTGVITAAFIYGGGLLYPLIGGRLFLVSSALCLLGLAITLRRGALRSEVAVG